MTPQQILSEIPNLDSLHTQVFNSEIYEFKEYNVCQFIYNHCIKYNVVLNYCREYIYVNKVNIIVYILFNCLRILRW